MALIPCKNCGRMISSHSATCPACGHQVNGSAPRPVPTHNPVTSDETYAYDGTDATTASKKRRTIMIVAALVAAAACGVGAWLMKQGGGEEALSETTLQSATAKEKATVYQSPDLAFFDLRGKVKTMTITYRTGQSETFNFDTAGNCLNINNNWVDGDKAVEVKRNNDGYIISAKWDMGFKVPAFERSIWIDGRLAERRYEDWEYSAKDRLEYSADGMLEKLETETVTGGVTAKELVTYKYLSTDSQGNWTDRERTLEVKGGDTKGDTKEVGHETRKITYY